MQIKSDNTKRKCAHDCLRKYYWEHVRGLKPKYGSSALRYGVVWHAGMDAYYSHIAEHGWSRDGNAVKIALLAIDDEWKEYSKKQEFYDDYRNLPNLMNSFLQYVEHFYTDEGLLRVIDSEVLFELEMVPETKEEELIYNNSWIFTGIIDLIIELSELPWALDHKTTGKSIDYVANQLRRDPQFIGYTYAGKRRLDVIPSGFMVSFHHISSTKSKVTGNYGKLNVKFDRRPEIYTEYDLTEWRLSFFETVARLTKSYETNIWPQQFNSCYNYGSCPFTNLCMQQVSIDKVYIGDFVVGEPWDVIAETKKRQDRRRILLANIKGETNANTQSI